MFTFGAVNSNRITFSSGPDNLYSNNRTSLIACWAKPSTLTATRALWGFGSICGLTIDTTTTSVRLTLPAATTAGVWTAPAGLTVGSLTFVAVLSSQNGAGGTAAIRVWTGTPTSGPVEQTVTNATAPVGAWTSTASTLTIGNLSSAASAFQGDLGGFVLLHDDRNLENLSQITGQATVGALTQVEADRARAVWVESAWRGDVGAIAGAGRMLNHDPASGNAYGFYLAASLDDADPPYALRSFGVPIVGTLTGPTLSAQKLPHPFPNQIENAIGPGANRSYVKVT